MIFKAKNGTVQAIHIIDAIFEQFEISDDIQ